MDNQYILEAVNQYTINLHTRQPFQLGDCSITRYSRSTAESDLKQDHVRSPNALYRTVQYLMEQISELDLKGLAGILQENEIPTILVGLEDPRFDLCKGEVRRKFSFFEIYNFMRDRYRAVHKEYEYQYIGNKNQPEGPI